MAESAALRFESVRELRRVTEREKELAREVWNKVEKDYQSFSVLVFKELFAADPSCKRFFLDILSGEDDPFQSKHFQKHMLTVLMPTVGGVILHLDSPDAVHEAMKRIGVLHKKKEMGLRRENVEMLCQVLLSTLKHKVSGYTELHEHAMTKVMTIVINMFINGLEGKTG